MKKRLRVAVGLVVAVAMGLAWRLTAPQVSRFIYATGTAQTDVATLSGFTPWNVEVAPGVTLRGVRRVPSKPDAEWVLFFHGNDPAQLATGAALLQRAVANTEIGLATVAYRGFDGSSGEPSPQALREDALQIFRALAVPAQRVRLVAFSFGAPVAIFLAAELSKQGTPPASLTLLAGAAELAMLPKVPWSKLLRGDLYRVGAELDEVKCPVRLLHGLDDTTLPIQHSQSLATRLGSRATLVELRGINHVTILTEPLSLFGN